MANNAVTEALGTLSDIVSFPNRSVARAARNFLEALKKDLLVAGYEYPDNVSKSVEVFTSEVDLYYEQERQAKLERLSKLSDVDELDEPVQS